MDRKLTWMLAFSLLAAGLAGCAGEQEATNNEDENIDADPGAGTDIGSEPGPDESVDTDFGAGTDVGQEDPNTA